MGLGLKTRDSACQGDLFLFPFPFYFLDPGSFTRLLSNLSGGLGYWEMRL